MRISDWSSDVCSSDLAAAQVAQTQALWEADMARRALAPTGIEFVLLKGAAYAAAGMACAAGRQIGDLDILVLATDIRRAANALLKEIGRAACRERVCQYV